MQMKMARQKYRLLVILLFIVCLLYWTVLLQSHNVLYFSNIPINAKVQPRLEKEEFEVDDLDPYQEVRGYQHRLQDERSKSTSKKSIASKTTSIDNNKPDESPVEGSVDNSPLASTDSMTSETTSIGDKPDKSAEEIPVDNPPPSEGENEDDNDDDDSTWAGASVEIHEKPDETQTSDQLPPQQQRVKHFPLSHKPNQKYFFYQPSGGWGNQRFILRWAMIVANAMNRTLAVAPLAPHADIWHGYNQWRKEDIVPADQVLDIQALQQSIDRGVVFLDDIPLRVVQRMQNTSRFSVEVFVKGHYTNKKREKLLVYRESEIRRTWGANPADIVFWDKMSMWQCCSPDFGPDSVWYGRHIMFNNEFKSLAKNLMSSFGEYNAIHVRRGDMTISKDRRNAEVYYKFHRLDRFDKSLPLYIATNEKDKSWFDALKQPGRFTRLVFWDDLDASIITETLTKFPQSMKGDILGFIEQLICGNAVRWEGSRKSTFSASISTVRMAPQLRTLTWSFPPKPSVRKMLAQQSGSEIPVLEEENELEEDSMLLNV